MLVGVISDTHDHLDNTRLAARILSERNVSLALHLGDIVSPFTLRLLADSIDSRLLGVYGNNDGDKLLLSRIASERGWMLVEQPYILEVDGRRLLLLHGFGSRDKTVLLVDSLAASSRFDAVLYGHTHKADLRRVGDTLVLNPGPVSGYLADKPSLAILDTDSMEAEIIYL
jgi:putative phosphoesterase